MMNGGAKEVASGDASSTARSCQRSVEATATHARTCKLSARTKGYDYCGEHVQAQQAHVTQQSLPVEGESKRGIRFQPPLLNRLYYYRELVIRAAVRRALVIPEEFLGPRDRKQILVLGAGLDRSSYDAASTTTEDNGVSDCIIETFEVDFPSVIEERRRIGASEVRTHTLVGLDLAAEGALEEIIRSGLKPGLHTVVIAESVLTYMQPDRVDALVRSLTATMASVALVCYDPLLPRGARGFSTQTAQCFSANKTPLLSASASRAELVARSARVWRHATALSVQVALTTLLPSAPVIPISLEPFDEFASIALLNRQYTLLLSSNPHPINWLGK